MDTYYQVALHEKNKPNNLTTNNDKFNLCDGAFRIKFIPSSQMHKMWCNNISSNWLNSYCYKVAALYPCDYSNYSCIPFTENYHRNGLFIVIVYRYYEVNNFIFF